MAEFDSNWVGWEFGVDRDGLVDVMCQPTGGLALVEVAARPRALVSELGAAAAQLPLAIRSKEVLYLSQMTPQPGSSRAERRYCNEMFSDFPKQKPAMKVLLGELQDILDPVREGLGAELRDPALHMVFGLRHRQKGHIDPTFVRAWCGADKPGFFVEVNGQRVEIPSLPEGHVLLMRGEFHPTLPGIRHGAVYRSSVVRRAVLLGM